MPLLENRGFLHNSRLCAASPQDGLNFWIAAQRPCWSLIFMNTTLTCGQDCQRIHFSREKKEYEERKGSTQHVKTYTVRQNFWDGEKNDSVTTGHPQHTDGSCPKNWFPEWLFGNLNVFLHRNGVLLSVVFSILGYEIFFKQEHVCHLYYNMDLNVRITIWWVSFLPLWHDTWDNQYIRKKGLSLLMVLEVSVCGSLSLLSSGPAAW
jgi:hypothetical protein